MHSVEWWVTLATPPSHKWSGPLSSAEEWTYQKVNELCTRLPLLVHTQIFLHILPVQKVAHLQGKYTKLFIHRHWIVDTKFVHPWLKQILETLHARNTQQESEYNGDKKSMITKSIKQRGRDARFIHNNHKFTNGNNPREYKHGDWKFLGHYHISKVHPGLFVCNFWPLIGSSQGWSMPYPGEVVTQWWVRF